MLDNLPPSGGWPRFDDLDREKSTGATWLRNSGYRTGYFGKYMNDYESRRIPPGWDRWCVKAGPERYGTINNQGTIIHTDTFQDAAFKAAAVRWVPRPASPSSKPFLPVADGDPPASWRTALLSYHWRVDTPLESGDAPEWWAKMTGRRTYVEYETGDKEFYRLDTDPYELENAYDTLSPEEKQSLHDRLENLKSCAGTAGADSCAMAENGG